MGKQNFKKRLAKVEATLQKDKPEVKTLDVLLNPLTASGTQFVYAEGIGNPPTGPANYDLTRGFIQGLENTAGNIDGNYCKLTSMDLRILIQNDKSATPQPTPSVRKIRLMIVRVPNASILTPVDIQQQVLEYGTPTTYGQLVNVSPLKRNSTINGGYDVMMDKIVRLTNNVINPNKSSAYIHFKKKWNKGMTLRFSGVAGTLTLEQNRIYLFAMDAENPVSALNGGAELSFVNRLRYSDE